MAVIVLDIKKHFESRDGDERVSKMVPWGPYRNNVKMETIVMFSNSIELADLLRYRTSGFHQ